MELVQAKKVSKPACIVDGPKGLSTLHSETGSTRLRSGFRASTLKRVSPERVPRETTRRVGFKRLQNDCAILRSTNLRSCGFFYRCALIRVTSPLSEAGRKHKCHADLVEQHVIRQLISAREYTKPVRFFASVDARKRLKPASTENGYKPFCSVDRP